MKKIVMSEKAYIIVGDLANVHRAQDALREICQPNSTDYISEKDYQRGRFHRPNPSAGNASRWRAVLCLK